MEQPWTARTVSAGAVPELKISCTSHFQIPITSAPCVTRYWSRAPAAGANTRLRLALRRIAGTRTRRTPRPPPCRPTSISRKACFGSTWVKAAWIGWCRWERWRAGSWRLTWPVSGRLCCLRGPSLVTASARRALADSLPVGTPCALPPSGLRETTCFGNEEKGFAIPFTSPANSWKMPILRGGIENPFSTIAQ